jgi:hypothetical protein
MSDRFNRSFSLPGKTWTMVSIPLEDVRTAPLSRDLDLSCVQSLGLFVTNPAKPHTLFLDAIYLKPPKMPGNE